MVDLTASVAELRIALTAVAVEADAGPMAAYMKHRFPFLGVKAPARRRAARPVLRSFRDAPADRVVAFVRALWAEPEREFHQVGADLLRAHATRLGAESLDDIRWFQTTNAWWDTVDTIAAHTVGPLVQRHRRLVTTMDDWIELDDDTSDSATSEMWLARTAILHQLTWKDDTDADRLFRYALRRAGDRQFFLRKAIGWALRQYAHTDPEAVRRFVADHDDVLSPLSVREATRHL